MQALLVLCAAGLLLFAGYSWGLSSGYERAAETSTIDRPSPPSPWQAVVLSVLGLVSLGAATALQGSGVRIPVPARLEELSARAEKVAVERAEAAASGRDG